MAKAAAFAANNAVRDGTMGFKHAAEIAREFKQFARFARDNGVRQMEYVSRELVVRYGQQLADRVSHHEIGQGQAQNAVSAINSVMRLATQGEWTSVSPTQECDIDQRSAIRNTPPTGLDREPLTTAVNALDARGQAVAALAREFGLRSKETSLLNAQAARCDPRHRRHERRESARRADQPAKRRARRAAARRAGAGRRRAR